MTTLQDVFGDVISVYTRQNAIDDGILIDVSETAREAGIKFPVAVTDAVWRECVEIPAGVTCQDEMGRLWDVIWMLRVAIGEAKRHPASERADRFIYSLYVRNHNGELTERDRVKLKAQCGPGDDAEPVITIMLPDED